MSILFAYGSLQIPEVWDSVVGLNTPKQAGLLQNFRRSRIIDRSYPGIRPHVGGECPGTLYLNVTNEMWIKLDAFEDDLYERKAVTIISDSELVIADAYVVKHEFHHLLSTEDWDIEHFKSNDLLNFLTLHL